MQENDRIRFFLGANSPRGFYSLYDQLIDPKQAQAIYILKGGPGCGKSTLMRRIAAQAEEIGEQVEYIHCSADPDSLDGIVLHGAKTAIVDGTAPHITEPCYPGAVENYVNLGDCYDSASLRTIRQDIMDCMVGYNDCYKRVYRCLNAATQITEDMRDSMTTQGLKEKAAKRAHGILKREARPMCSGTGRVTRRFLDAITHQGTLTFYSTAHELCKRVYFLEDSCGFSHLILSPLLAGLSQSGYDVIACPSPMDPDRLEHLMVPELSLAFLRVPPGHSLQKCPYRKIRIDAMIDSELLRQNKNRLRFSQKISAALIDEAVDSLAQAKAMHDNLEALYNPHVNFERVNHIADQLSKAILID